MSEDVSKLLLKMGSFLLYTVALSGAIALTVAWNKVTHSLRDWQDDLGLRSSHLVLSSVMPTRREKKVKQVSPKRFPCLTSSPLIFPQENFTFFVAFPYEPSCKALERRIVSTKQY